MYYSFVREYSYWVRHPKAKLRITTATLTGLSIFAGILIVILSSPKAEGMFFFFFIEKQIIFYIENTPKIEFSPFCVEIISENAKM